MEIGKKGEKEIGEISHYYPGIEVAVVEVLDEIRVGEEIAVRGYTTDFTQTIDSMEIGHKKVDAARKGDSVGLKVKDRVREGDKVYWIPI